MGRCGRYLEPITRLQRAGRLTLYGELKAAFKDIGGLDPWMRVAPDCYSASISASTSNVTYPGIGPSVCDRIFRVTPGVVAGGVVCAEAPAAMNSASPQIAQPATPVKFLRVSMATSLPSRSTMCPGIKDI